MNGYYPIGRIGTLIGTSGSRIVGHGIDFSSFSFNFDSFKAPGIVIRANGSPTIGSTTALTLATGELGITTQAASGTAPGAAGVKLGVVCGTNAGSAKIIAYGGTSTTPVMVLDNIGSGVAGC